MDIEEQPYDDRHNVPPARDVNSGTFQLSIPDAIDAVRQYRREKPTMYPRFAEAMRVVTDELEARFNAEQAPVNQTAEDPWALAPAEDVDREVGGNTLRSAIDHLAQMIDEGVGSVSMRDAASVVLFALRQRLNADVKQNDPTEPMPGTPLDTASGLRYIAPGGKFAAYWGGLGDGPYLAQVSLLDLRILSAHLTTAIDHVTAELELRRK